MDQIPSFHTAGLLKDLGWLRQLSVPVEKIVIFGCESSEPFVLFWMLEASELKVVEKDDNSLSDIESMGPREELEFLCKNHPNIYKPNSVEFIIADMSTTIPELPSDYFDLAFCENVLYFMEDDSKALKNAVTQMVRVAKPGGWVIAVESQFGETHPPKDISCLFDSMGLVLVTLNGSPPWAYCFIKSAM